MTANETFRANYAELQALLAEFVKTTDLKIGMARDLDREIAPMFKGRKAKWDRVKRWAAPEAADIVAKYRKMAADFMERYHARRAELEKSLEDLAPQCDLALEKTETWSKLGERSVTCYMSTGRGEEYAKAGARTCVDQADMYGVETRILEDKDQKGRIWAYIVEARLTPAGIEMLKGKPGPTLREWVRLCWKRGVNPRVYQPFLPHGYEEQHGLDCFGGEIVKSSNR